MRAALVCEPVTIRCVLCEFDTTGVGSHREPSAVFGDLRRMGDLHRRYPFGGRRISHAYLRGREFYAYNSRFWENVFTRMSK
ncbi:Uncharacterised protein [Mycobacterium tuberculosis]|uniref:Uncharacterized protein n=1 Tax=Mycobacterium tuberculosis TaxID=1773 RepID=A0A916LDM2_MYCTX|nr:Uncharacterised protein [Mycobacterium tuberculosis]COY92277.1 Uncharacterised protein [Mycobacterium tuberculosis]